MSNEPPIRAELPENALINCEITITSYFEGDGELMYATSVEGDVNLAQVIGLLRLAEISVYRSYNPKEEDNG